MSKPATDNVDINASLEEVDGSRVPPHVRGYVECLAGRPRRFKVGGKLPYTLVDAEPSEWVPGGREKHRCLRIGCATLFD